MGTSTGLRSPSVLVVARDEWLARSFESILAPHGCTVARRASVDDAADPFESADPDVLLVECGWTDAGDPTVLHSLREQARVGPGTCVLLVTAAPLSRRDRLAALRAGAWEVLGFPLDAEELLLRVVALAAMRRDVSRAEERGLVDPLTGLYNARGLARRAQEMVSEAQRHHRALACLVVTANGSDAAGAPAADDRLAETMAQVLTAAARDSDAVGRLRGAELAVLAPGTGRAGAERLEKRLAAALREGLAARGWTSPQLRTGWFALEPGDDPGGMQPMEMLARAARGLHQAPAAEDVAAPEPALA
jgi:diguanylate cyclase (GGDEF)-like protein